MIFDFGIFTVDFSFWLDFFNQTPARIIFDLFWLFGWAIIGGMIFHVGAHFWEDYRAEKYTANWDFILLAIDVPAIAVQTPKAVEQIFAHLSGAYEPANIWERFWQGKQQRWFSFEIISIEGYIQFLVWTEKEARDLVESAIYAQYPEAEITEVEDYAAMVPDNYPNNEYDMHGVEFCLAENDAYPIRTYPDFKYDVTPDITFSDSMAAMLENFTRIGKGENLWFQIIIVPTGGSWKEHGIDLVKEIIGGGKHHSESIISKLGDIPRKLVQEAVVYGIRSGEISESSHEEASAGKVSDLTPGGRKVVEAVEEKLSKVGFKSKIRLLYVARKEDYYPRRCVGGVVGAMNQFHIPNRNALVSYGSTMHKGVDHDIDKNLFFKSYKKRKAKMGGNPYILNTEELATLWHFPMPFVKTPLVQKTYAKRAEAPSDLPIESMESPLRPKKIQSVPYPRGEAPFNLPLASDSQSLPSSLINEKPLMTDASKDMPKNLS